MTIQNPVHLTPDTPVSVLVPILLPNADTLALDGMTLTDQQLTLSLHTTTPATICPTCQQSTTRIHSRYQRTLADTAWGTCPLVLRLTIRRFRCDNPECSCTAFTERVPHVAPVAARRTTRLCREQGKIAHALGGAAGARRCQQQGIPTSRQTLLRMLRQPPPTSPPAPTIVGIDDWSWGKGQSMGTIVVDLARRQTIALLPDDREATVAAWLKQHPSIQVVCRDRSKTYANAITAGAPQARQIVDRWHLGKNVGEVVERVAERHGAARQAAANPPPPETAPAPAAEAAPDAAPAPAEAAPVSPRQAEKQRQFEQVKQLHAAGFSQRAIGRELGLDRRTVKKYILAETFPGAKHRRVSTPSTVQPYAEHVGQRCQDGATMQTIWEELREQGYTGSYSSVQRFIKRHGLARGGTASPPRRQISARAASILLLTPIEQLDEERAALRERLEVGCPELRDSGERARALLTIIRDQDGAGLQPWLDAAQEHGVPELQRFAAGLVQEQDAVQAALEEPWSTGQVEGQITKLKLVKRSMYGRAKRDLLEARMRAAA
jgi:transposase